MSVYEERHRALRHGYATGWSARELLSIDFEAVERFEQRTAPLVDEVIAAAREMLKFGAHDGPCEPMADGRCRLHTEALDRRQQALMDALARLDEVASW